MTLLTGLTTATVTGGPYGTLTGDVAFAGMVGVLSVSTPLNDAVNGGVLEAPVTVTIASDGTFTLGPLPCTDDPNLTQGGTYTLSWQVGRFADCPHGRRDTTFVLPMAAGATVDFDLMTPTNGVYYPNGAGPVATTNALLTESGNILTTEAGNVLVTA